MVQLQLVSSATSSAALGLNSKLYTSSSQCNMDNSTVCKHALLKKAKTGKYKFFVLHKDSATASARLEYYESESQWVKKKKARRTIYLRTCFSINPFTDPTKFGITLFTKDESLKIVFDSEQMRDMWIADMRLLKHSSSEKSHSPVQHIWCVQAHTRGMNCSLEGSYKLCLNDQQASLISQDDPENVVLMPLHVITECHHNNKFFGLEVNHEAETGPGEIWLELEDALIAQHVHRAFEQNLLIASKGDSSFRPVSRSLSFKDRKSLYSARLRSGSDAKQRGRVGQNLAKPNPSNRQTISSSNFLGFHHQRDRSDSIDSHSTSASLSTDESDSYHNSWQSTSRSVTPDFQPHYMPINLKRDDNCKPMSSNGSLSGDAATSDSYLDMTVQHIKPHDKNSNFVYVDMTGSHNLPYIDKNGSGYIDMTFGQNSPNSKGYRLKPEPVKCLIDTEGSDTQPKSELTTNQRSSASPLPQNDEYVLMCRRKMLTDKSSSAPHLLPFQQHTSTEYQTDPDIFMNIDFDNRNRTSSLSCSHRPRNSSWSQFTRPRSSTTDHKRRASRMHRTNNNNLSNGLKATDYIDMTCGSSEPKDFYVEMSLDKKSKERLAAITSNEKDDKENHSPPPARLSRVNRVPTLAHPFPELLSASSEDDVSLHSMEGSASLHSLTSSADSMSTSSHSSHHGSAFTSSLDMEPYVATQMAPSSNYTKCCGPKSIPKLARVVSYIVDDTNGKSKIKHTTKHPDYMEMSPASKHTKQ